MSVIIKDIGSSAGFECGLCKNNFSGLIITHSNELKTCGLCSVLVCNPHLKDKDLHDVAERCCDGDFSDFKKINA